MILRLNRINKTKKYTEGQLWINDKYFCDTLELAEGTGRMTAIPSGEYTINLNIISPKFANRTWAKCCQGKVPTIEGVPNRTRILIHVGNTTRDTEGCILVGENSRAGYVGNSSVTFERLIEALYQSTWPIKIIVS